MIHESANEWLGSESLGDDVDRAVGIAFDEYEIVGVAGFQEAGPLIKADGLCSVDACHT